MYDMMIGEFITTRIEIILTGVPFLGHLEISQIIVLRLEQLVIKWNE